VRILSVFGVPVHPELQIGCGVAQRSSPPGQELCDSENARPAGALSSNRVQDVARIASTPARRHSVCLLVSLKPNIASPNKRLIVLVLIGSYLLLVFVLPVALSVVVSYRALPQGRHCPQCRGDTIPLLAPRLRALKAVAPLRTLQRRWCLCCGWEGTSRVGRAGTKGRPATAHLARPAPPAPRPAEPRAPAQPDAPGHFALPHSATPAQPPARRATAESRPARATQTLDVRSLDLDGAAWRVMLQCWNSTGLFYGRFIFVGPSGRLWLDAVESFSGANEHEVLGQALSLPEGMLENRLRRLVSG
jgi:hypothetical protein